MSSTPSSQRDQHTPAVMPRVLGAAAVTIVGGVVFVNGQPASAATFTVTNTNDSGAGSLRQAILDANLAAGEDTIVFSGLTDPSTITLLSPLPINDDLRIVGPGQTALTLTNASGDVLYLYNGADLYLSNVTIDGAGDDGIQAGSAYPVSAIAGDVILNSVTISDSYDAGIEMHYSGNLEVIDSTISNNYEEGIDVYDAGDVTITGSTISGNGDNGVELDSVGTTSVTDSYISDNGSDAYDDGLDVDDSGNITITDSVISGNYGDGVYGRYVGDVTITGTDVTDNGTYAYSYNQDDNVRVYGGGDVTITDSDLSGSIDDDGLEARRVDDVVITGTTVSNGDDDGIRIYDADSVEITDSTVSGNEDDNIFVSNVEYGVLIEDVTADDALDDEGIDIYNVGDDVTIRRATVTNSDDKGIEIDRVYGDVLIEDTTVTNSGDDGIDIDDVSGTTTIRDTTVSGTTDDNGIRLNNVDDGLVERSTITGAYDDGFDIYQSTVELLNTTVSGNTDSGIEVGYSSDLTIRHSTITDNGAYGIYVNNLYIGEAVAVIERAVRPTTTISIDHSIVSGNTNDDISDASDVSSVDHSIVDVGSALTSLGTGNIEDDDPALGALADNGGLTETRLPEAASPAVNAGDAAITGEPATDQRSLARKVGTIDIGAVEVNPGMVDMADATISVDESAGTATITIVRSGGSDNAATVDVTTTVGTAGSPGDFTTTSATVSWASGESGSKTVNVPITDDAVPEPSENFTVTLSNPTGGVTIGADTTTVTITDTDVVTTTTTTTTVAPTTTDAGAGVVTIPATGSNSTTGPLAWIASLFVGLGALLAGITRRTRPQN